MSYFLRLDNKKNGVYLQMYDRFWDPVRKQARYKSVKAFGYVHDLISDDIPDPVSYFKHYVAEEELKRKQALLDETRPRAFQECIEKNVGYFLLSSLMDELGVKEDIDILSSVMNFRFSIYDMIAQLIYSRVIFPCSKSKTVSSVFPRLYQYSAMSEDQVYDGLYFVGENYKKYIELFNHQYEKFYKRNFDQAFFDCTNYYFEIDLPKDDKQKGPSKENRKEPIIGQALLLDGDLVPLAMQMYPGNQSEKPYIRNIIEEMKNRYKVNGKTVQVADKGLNCARNIYAAVKEANDGYIFSKSIHGTGLSAQEKQWILLENGANKYKDYLDEEGNIKFRLKYCVDEFNYSFKETDEQTGKDNIVRFKVKEKRIVSYTPSLARKQRAEITKMIEKATNYKTYKDLTQEEIRDNAKYIKVITVDDNGKKISPKIELNQDKIDEDLKLAGYNLIVTSEISMDPLKVYETYHSLWKIEECFRITKSFLDGRPVYLQTKETIYGHFLICYLSLFLLRVLEIKCFRNQVNSYDIIEFIRDFRIVKKDDDLYINISHNKTVNDKIKKVTGKNNLDALYLSKKEINNLFSLTSLINS